MALLLTLAIIALLCLMVLGLTSTMKIERDISVSYSEDIQARRIGEAALARALFCLTSNTPPATVFVAAPGQIWQITASGLFTNGLGLFNQDNRVGERPLLRNALEENNLNSAGLVCGDNARYPAPNFTQDTNWFTQTLSPPYTTDPYFTPFSFLTPGWVTLGTNHQQAGGFASWTNPIIGRFAFWLDAETCKINVNTAGSRTYTNSFFPPAITAGDVDLRALSGAFANNDTLVTAFLTARSTAGGFLTHEAMRGAASELYSLASFQTNKFSTTIYGTTTNLDVFGNARANLNTLTAGTIPAAFTNSRYATDIYPDKTWATNRNTLAGKYGNFGAQQIVANIIDYQAPATNWPSHDTLDPQLIPSTYCGLKKGPLIQNIIVHVATNAAPAGAGITNLLVRTFVDVKFVNGYELDRGSNWRIKVEPTYVIVSHSGAAIDSPTTNAFPAVGAAVLTSNVSAHSFGLLSSAAGGSPPEIQTLIPGSNGPPPVVSSVVVGLKSVRLLIDNSDQAICDWMAPGDFNAIYPTGMYFPASNIVGYVTNAVPDFDAAQPSPNSKPLALGKHDPRVRTFVNGPTPSLTANWFAIATTNVNPIADDNFTSQLSPTLYALLANVRADNGGGRPSHRYLDSLIRESAMTSVGELGYIHTGYPWRTLRLGPVYPLLTNSVTAVPTGTSGWSTNAVFTDPRIANFISDGSSAGDPNTANPAVEINAIPDWVMLDMFTAGTPITAGRININNRMTGPAGALPARVDPIGALLWNAESNLTAVAGTTVGYRLGGSAYSVNVYDLLTRAIAEGVSFAGSPYAALSAFGDYRIPVYRTPGEICETIGINYRFLATPAQCSQADRTRLLTRIAPLITTSSDTFTIWAVAEHVEDTNRDGKFDWMYQAKYRYTDKPPGFSDAAYTNYILNATLITNYVTKLVDGDGNGDSRQDRICGRFRIQAVVQRYGDPAHPKYRTLFVRYFPN